MVMTCTPLARMVIWSGTANDRQGHHAHAPTPAELDLLDEIRGAGGVQAYLKRGNSK